MPEGIPLHNMSRVLVGSQHQCRTDVSSKVICYNACTCMRYLYHTYSCVFSPGVLSQRYSIQWFNGLSTINTTDSRLSITSDFSLVINNVNVLDASSAYYCVVDVNNDFFSYHSIGPSVELLVTGE